MSDRVLNDWLSAYIKYTERSEPPLSFHTWVGLSVISGALQRRIHLSWGFEKIFPNLYVVLVAPSGRARKGIAINTGKDILKEVTNVTLTSESTTREALIRIMKGAISNYSDPLTGVVAFHCAVTCFSEELAVFLGQSDIKFLANLTDWYDSKDNWTYETKGTGRDHLQGLCFNLLGATAPDWIQSMLPQEAVGGGFTSRVLFIVEEKKRQTVPKHVLTQEEIDLKESLTQDLVKISNLSGAFSFTQAGEKAYTEWYASEDKKIGEGYQPVADPRFGGYCERRATHLRKLMMLMSVSRGDSLQIDQIDFDRSLITLEAAERKMYKTFGGLGSARYSEITEKVLDYLRTKKLGARSEILRKFRRDIDPGIMKIIEDLMVQMKVVKISIVPASDERIYNWLGDGEE